MGKRILITTGGTGGHVFPSQALAQQLVKIDPKNEIMFVGGGLKNNSFFSRGHYPYQEVPCATFREKGMFRKILSSATIVKGIFSSMGVIRKFKPDVIVGFGSYHSLPTLCAATLGKVPLVLHEGNIIPGKVNKFFSRYAKITGVSFPQTGLYLNGKSLRVSFPLREGYTSSFASREDALSYYHLSLDRFTFLVFGGSQGAMALNTHVCAAMMELAERSQKFQVIHLTGNSSASEEIRKLYRDLGIQAVVKDFETQMDTAWAAADFVVSRAGASGLAEQIEMEKPGILIPYPFAADAHQDRNAEYMVGKVQGALMLKEMELVTNKLSTMISSVISNNKAKFREMEASIREYKQQNRYRDFCSVICEVAGIKVR